MLTSIAKAENATRAISDPMGHGGIGLTRCGGFLGGKLDFPVEFTMRVAVAGEDPLTASDEGEIEHVNPTLSGTMQDKFVVAL